MIAFDDFHPDLLPAQATEWHTCGRRPRRIDAKRVAKMLRRAKR